MTTITLSSSREKQSQTQLYAQCTAIRSRSTRSILPHSPITHLVFDDATFILHFFLAFQRFASPRAVLLGMQKRLRALAAAPADVLLAKFAQMKICTALEHRILNYPDDFAILGAPTELQALLRQLIMHVHTAHYGSELLPFLETIPRMRPRANAWYKPIEDALRADSDDKDGGAGTGAGDSDNDRGHSAMTQPSSANGTTTAAGAATLVPPPQLRERASSFPVQSTSTIMGASTSALATAPATAPGLGRIASPLVLAPGPVLCLPCRCRCRSPLHLCLSRSSTSKTYSACAGISSSSNPWLSRRRSCRQCWGCS
ncbi:hypothetical protein BKA62DRAFT_475964 [Auriculariales sp. MPI-PUGE-AT-0066]|nr:hypothetical protein BKA62DRAFT_475964 [Auriculariales sp. MPI-PUGE-AT-0066]